MNARRLKILGCAGAATLSSACAPSFSPAFERDSELAPQVRAAIAANRTYPRWSDFPRTRIDTPSTEEVGRQVDGLRAGESQLETQVAAIDWQVGPEVLEEARAAARVAAAVPPSPDGFGSPADIEAFAQRLRERAKAPPPVDRRLPTP